MKEATPSCALIFVGLLACLKSILCKDLVSEPFNVVPGGQVGTYVGKWKDIACEFSYVCQGGTNEEWEMLISRDKDNMFVCKVSRPEGTTASYLFFQSFEMKIIGGGLQAAVVLGENAQHCGSEEYTVDTENNLVYSDKGFKSHLNRVFAIFKQGRDDL